MTLSSSPDIDASYLTLGEGEYDQSLPFDFEVEGVTLNVDVDASGLVLGLEILGASKVFALIAKRGELSLPQTIPDLDGFCVDDLFKAPTLSGVVAPATVHG